MATDLIRYDLIVQDAMRGVVRKVLADLAASGYLPGDHHFTISFRTGAPGVKISKRLAEQWPIELTIILQHQYSDLMVDDEGFGVTLSFRGKAENLYVPFETVTGFFDPSVEFGLKFVVADEQETEAAETAKPARPGPTLVLADAAAEAEPAPAKAEQVEPARKPEPSAPPGEPAKIVSIDAFRKKR
jgi:hypothetical protein